MSLLESIHGVAIRPNSDDVTAEVTSDKIMLGRPGGLTLSSADGRRANARPTAARPIFDVPEWRKNQAVNFVARQDELISPRPAALEPDQRIPARLDLARFYHVARHVSLKPRAFSIWRSPTPRPGSRGSQSR